MARGGKFGGWVAENYVGMAKVAKFYCWERQLINIPAVFDVIAVSLDDPDNPKIEHFEDVYRPETRY